MAAGGLLGSHAFCLTAVVAAEEPDESIAREEEQRERYRELLEELRTIIPGVQVLFAFLLTAPFSARFETMDDLGLQVFAVSLLTVGLAAVVLLTPAAYHRLTPGHDRHRRLRLGVRVAVTGMALLSISIGCAVFVVGRLIFTTQPAAPAALLSAGGIGAMLAAVISGTAVFLWFVLPWLQRRADDS